MCEVGEPIWYNQSYHDGWGGGGAGAHGLSGLPIPTPTDSVGSQLALITLGLSSCLFLASLHIWASLWLHSLSLFLCLCGKPWLWSSLLLWLLIVPTSLQLALAHLNHPALGIRWLSSSHLSICAFSTTYLCSAVQINYEFCLSHIFVLASLIVTRKKRKEKQKCKTGIWPSLKPEFYGVRPLINDISYVIQIAFSGHIFHVELLVSHSCHFITCRHTLHRQTRELWPCKHRRYNLGLTVWMTDIPWYICHIFLTHVLSMWSSFIMCCSIAQSRDKM